jgi:hypothetical protein
VFDIVSQFHPSLIFDCKAGAGQVEPLLNSTIRLGLVHNIRLGYTRATLTNSLAYYFTKLITSVKIYMIEAQQSHFYLKFTLELKYKVSALTINAPKNWTINQFYQNI